MEHTRDAYSVRDNFLFNFVFYGPSRTPVPTISGLRCPCLWHLRGVEHIFDEDSVDGGGLPITGVFKKGQQIL